MRQPTLLALSLGVLLAVSSQNCRCADDGDEKLLKGAGIPTDGPGLLAYFRHRTADASDSARILALVRELGDDSFAVREGATRKLVAIGPRARHALRASLNDSDPEVARRAEDCLRQINAGASASVIAAAVRMLARHNPPRAAEVLLAYLPSAEDESVGNEVRAVLVSLAVRDGKADLAVVAALEDANAARRAAAGVALAQAGLAEHLPAVRKLLDDPEPRVRLRVALALTGAKDKEAVPALIRLLDILPAEETGVLEELLYRLAGDKAPTQMAGVDPVSRRKFREAWQSWWTENHERIDPAQLAESGRVLGYTLVVLLDQGRVIELDAANRPRWQVNGLQFPLDVQLLPGGERFLTAEYHANRVTERDTTGKILWEHRIPEPLAAQRLANGNTFISSRTRLVEVDKDGKEVSSYTRPGGDNFMKATKLRNGDVACVTLLGVPRFVRLSPEGKDYREVRSFGVALETSGGRIDVLPNGNVLVPEKDNNRVAEYDTNGRVVHQIAIDQPVAAIRLPNGNTLVTSMTQQRAVELTREGKEVWQYRSDTRVTRAFRR
jgi:hypothetical protein